MNGLYLDLRDKPRVVDFLVEAAPYADTSERQAAEAVVKKYQDGERISTDKLAEAARTLAIATWPQRYAINRYFIHEGKEEEWNRVLAAVRPSTAHLMKRFRRTSKAKSLDEVLKHDEVGATLRDEETQEIEHTRAHLREDYWKGSKETLSALVKQGEQKREEYMKRLGSLRDVADALPLSLQDEVFSKLRHYEDRIMFAGEEVPLEILDEEIKYYTEQREISPLEG